MIDLLRALHAAGWTYRKELIDGGRDFDGSPVDLEVRHWLREGAEIRVDEYFVWWQPAEADEFETVDVGFGWIRANGAAGLRKLAETLGILPPDVPEGLTKLTVYLTERALTALNASAEAEGGTKTDTVNRALIDYAATAGAKAVLSLAIGLPKAKVKS